jgi:hypothetical protein
MFQGLRTDGTLRCQQDGEQRVDPRAHGSARDRDGGGRPANDYEADSSANTCSALPQSRSSP